MRPLGLVFGVDARALVAEGVAGALGGLDHVAFTRVEIITRRGTEISRRMDLYKAWREHPVVREICARRAAFGGVTLERTRIMGIVNVTPDSFSDGGRLGSAAAAVDHGQQLASEGADILDVGGESTRPGSDTVDVAEELDRVLPVISGLSASHCVSADTRKAGVMAAALKAGARIINDVSALSYDAGSAGLVAAAGAPVVLMHAQGEPKTMQLNPRYSDVVLDVYDGLAAAVARAEAAGIAREKLCVDPGIGFGKSFRQNLDLLAGLTVFHGLGLPVLVGLSRKAFIGAVTGEKTAADRVHGSVGGAVQAALAGAHILRVHDVKATVAAVKMFTASADPDSVDL
jgi:dihydropteroate synthase